MPTLRTLVGSQGVVKVFSYSGRIGSRSRAYPYLACIFFKKGTSPHHDIREPPKKIYIYMNMLRNPPCMRQMYRIKRSATPPFSSSRDRFRRQNQEERYCARNEKKNFTLNSLHMESTQSRRYPCYVTLGPLYSGAPWGGKVWEYVPTFSLGHEKYGGIPLLIM